ncbi:MAG TPA: NAD(+) diphosphatase, partial [Candidatus Dorea intestinavium]|nr:NAD(+) diphosphatase [Candidatus Dorea intestinavium]
PVGPSQDDVFLIYRNNKIFMSLKEGEITYPRLEELKKYYPNAQKDAKFLFKIDNNDYYEIRKYPIGPFNGYDYYDLGELRTSFPSYRAFAGITGAQIHNWYNDTTYCGRCSTKLKPKGDERAMICPNPDCGKVYYPVISPSVIVGVIKGNQILLTKYNKNHSKYRKYGLVAGYTEIGETLEATVIREVKEEVGLKVENVRYYKSQPWSYSGTILAGFFCEVVGDPTVTLEEEELEEATWFNREEIPKVDNTISLTTEMIEYFRNHPEAF